MSFELLTLPSVVHIIQVDDDNLVVKRRLFYVYSYRENYTVSFTSFPQVLLNIFQYGFVLHYVLDANFYYMVINFLKVICRVLL